MKQIYRQILFSTTKYVLLRNFFIAITGIVSIFIVRLLGPSEYGKYSLVWNLISTVGPILSLGWLNTLAKFVPERTDDKGKSLLFSQSLFTVLIASVLFFLVINFIYRFFPHFFPVEIKDTILIFCLFIILVAFFNIFEGFWRGLGKFNQFVIIDGLRSNLGNILGLFLLLVGYLSYKTLITVNFLTSVVFFILLFILVKNYITLHFATKLENQIIKFSLSLLLGQIIYMLSVNLDILLLRGLLKDSQQVGYYTAGVRIPKMIEAMVINQISAPMLYYFSSSEIKHLKEKILKFNCKMLGFVFGILGLIFFSFAQYIVLFLFSDKFESSVSIFKYYSLVLPLVSFLILISPYYISQNKPFVVIVFNFFIMVVIFNVLNLFLIPNYKSFALVINYLISFSLFSILICLDCNKRFKVNLIKDLMILFMFILLSVAVESFFKIPSFMMFIFLYFITKNISLEDVSKFFSILK